MIKTSTPGGASAQAVVTVGTTQHALDVVIARRPIVAMAIAWAKARRHVRRHGLDLAVISVTVTQPHEGIRR